MQPDSPHPPQIFVRHALVEAAAKLAGNKLKDVNAEAKAKHDYLTAMVTGFELDLEKGEKERVLLRSIK
jgi:hypothetical protein